MTCVSPASNAEMSKASRQTREGGEPRIRPPPTNVERENMEGMEYATPPGPPGIPLEVWLSIQCAPALVKISTESLSPDSLAILNAVLFQRSFSSGFAPASSSMRIYAGR